MFNLFGCGYAALGRRGIQLPGRRVRRRGDADQHGGAGMHDQLQPGALRTHSRLMIGPVIINPVAGGRHRVRRGRSSATQLVAPDRPDEAELAIDGPRRGPDLGGDLLGVVAVELEQGDGPERRVAQLGEEALVDLGRLGG